ncbi:hypothetical protein DFJ73DRAFT_493959 [Zopfochytrium polystomum]|nr:hypothetical protein DFJ73DRAFT_493959 [Zopfochytrium polystomum]
MAQSKDLYILRYRDWDLTQIYSFTTKPQYTRLPSSFCFSKLHPEAKKCAENKIVELDDCMEQYLQATLLNFGENTEEVNKTQSEYLVTGLRLYILRKEFNRLTLQGDVIKNEAQLSEVIKFYKMRIVVGAVRLYFKLGARGNATAGVLLRDVSIVSAADSEMNRQSQAAFERCQISVLLGELVRLHTVQMLRQAKQYYDKLADERAGRLFQLYDTIEVNAQRGERAFAYKLSEDISSLKTNILLTFVEDLHKANASWLKERKVQQGALQPFKLNEAKGQLGNLLPLDDSKMFSCTKDSLTQAVISILNCTDE